MTALIGAGLVQPSILKAACFSTQINIRLTNRVDTPRQSSHRGASTSGREHFTVCSAWLGSKSFDNSKLNVRFLPSVHESGPELPSPRKYTLTHSDITGKLWLSIGQQYNHDQLSGWYLQLFRDEVLAEWRVDQTGKPQLHLFCHISSGQKWSGPIPPAMRSRIFQREMPLVLKTLLYGDRNYLRAFPGLMGASVFLHLSSHVQALNIHMEWGILGDEKSWRQPMTSWFEVWWKSSVEPAHKPDIPADACLSDIATAELSQPQPNLPNKNKSSLDVAFAAAPVNRGKAQAHISSSGTEPASRSSDLLGARNSVTQRSIPETHQKPVSQASIR